MAFKITTGCVGCMICHKGCPQGAIYGNPKEIQTIDPNKCIECGYCANVCNMGAVKDSKGHDLVQIPKKDWQKPIINRSVCVGCSVCVQNCPGNCLAIEDAKFHGDINTIAYMKEPKSCIGCKICRDVCPIGAITFADDLNGKNDKNNGKRRMTMGKAYAKVYQGVFSVGMGLMPWGVPKTLEGPGSVKKLPQLIKEQGYTKVLVVTDKVLYQDLHMLDGLLEEMPKAGVEYVVYDGVQPNPTDININEGLKLFKENKCQAMIAFGRGSPMDCAKGIGAVYVKNKPAKDLQGLFRVLHKIPTIFAVPTTSGTGSETTIAAVITEVATHHKASINDLSLMPKFAVLDPELTKGLPGKVTSTTGMDALCHAVECYTNNKYNSKLEKRYSEEAVKLIYDNLYECYTNPGNLEARMNMMTAAFKAGRAFTRGCVGYVHAIGHTLGGLYGTPHGLAMSVILPHVMRQFGPAAYERLARLAEVCGHNEGTDAEKANWFIDWMEELKEKMSIPRTLDVVKPEDYDQIIAWASKEANPLYPTPVYWEKADFVKCLDTISGK